MGGVVSGRTSVDQKAITGESVPVPEGVGDPVFAGTVNGDGGIEVETTRPADDSLVSRIVTQVRAAQAGRAPIVQSVERFAAYYTPVVVLLALLVMVVPPLWLGYQGAAVGERGLEYLDLARAGAAGDCLPVCACDRHAGGAGVGPGGGVAAWGAGEGGAVPGAVRAAQGAGF